MKIKNPKTTLTGAAIVIISTAQMIFHFSGEEKMELTKLIAPLIEALIGFGFIKANDSIPDQKNE